jgi:hypothetical protein
MRRFAVLITTIFCASAAVGQTPYLKFEFFGGYLVTGESPTNEFRFPGNVHLGSGLPRTTDSKLPSFATSTAISGSYSTSQHSFITTRVRATSWWRVQRVHARRNNRWS